MNRVARKYLKNESAVVGVLTPHPSGKAVSLQGSRDTESFSPEQAKPVPVPDWAAKSTRLPALPVSRIHPSVFTLSNGLRLIVQPESISGTVCVYGRVKNTPELQEPVGQEGVTEVLEGLFSYGTTTYDRLAFQKELDEIAADLEVGRVLSLQVLSDHFDRGVELLADNLLHPALPPRSFQIVRRETAAQREVKAAFDKWIRPRDFVQVTLGPAPH